MEEKRNKLKDLSSSRTFEAWRPSNELTLAAVILFNRQRQGEASKMKLEDCLNRPKQNGAEMVMQSLSAFEEQLCRSFDKVVIVGKRGNVVHLLMAQKTKEALDMLIKYRSHAGVKSL